MSERPYMLEKLMQLAQISKHINMTMDQDEIVQYAIAQLPDIMGLSIMSIFLLDKRRKSLFMVASTDKTIDSERMSRIKFGLGEGLIGKVGRTLEPIVIEDVEKSDELADKNDPKYGDKSCRIIPMVSGGALVGVITMTSKLNSQEDAYHDQVLLSLFADHIAIGIKNAQLLASAREKANRDGLTKLYTHRYFHSHLDREIFRARRYHLRLSLLMLDVDNFKQFNDKHGHLVGDEVLVGVAAIMLANMRVGVDIPCRYGGDEFAAILPETGLQAAFDAAERIRQMVDLLQFSAKGEKLNVGLSIGVCEYTGSMSKTQFIERTDDAMYQSKKDGRKRTTKALTPDDSAD